MRATKIRSHEQKCENATLLQNSTVRYFIFKLQKKEDVHICSLLSDIF